MTKTIAIICQVEKRHVIGKLAGGIMAVERFHAEMLSELGYTVHFITTADSDDLWPNGDIITAKLCAGCEEAFEASGVSTKQSRGMMNKERTAAINDYVRTIQPDVVINHSFSLSHLNLCVELSKTIPVIHFLHCLPEAMADMGMFGKFAAYRKLTEHGSEVACVSMYQRDQFVDMLTRRMAKGSEHFKFLEEPINGVPAVQAIFNRVCYSCIAEPSSVYDPNDYYVVIGRPEPDKNIGKLLAGLVELKKKGIEPKVKIFMAFGGDLDDYEYYREKMAPHVPLLPEVQFFNNQPRELLLDTLKKAKGFIVTAPESCGIAPIEALQYGVPSIVICKRDKVTGKLHHACYDIMDDGIQQTFIPVSGDRKEFVSDLEHAFADATATKVVHRDYLRNLAIRRHSRDVRKKELDDAINDVIDTYQHKVKRPSLLSF